MKGPKPRDAQRRARFFLDGPLPHRARSRRWIRQGSPGNLASASAMRPSATATRHRSWISTRHELRKACGLRRPMSVERRRSSRMIVAPRSGRERSPYSEPKPRRNAHSVKNGPFPSPDSYCRPAELPMLFFVGGEVKANPFTAARRRPRRARRRRPPDPASLSARPRDHPRRYSRRRFGRQPGVQFFDVRQVAQASNPNSLKNPGVVT